jgi:hypothetical protein
MLHIIVRMWSHETGLAMLTVSLNIAGIMFRDITTLLLDPAAFQDSIDLFVARYKDQNIKVIAGKSHASILYTCGGCPYELQSTSELQQ